MFILNILLFLTLTVLCLISLSQYRYFMMFYLLSSFFLPYIGNNRQSKKFVL